MSYDLVYTKKAAQDIPKLKAAKLADKAQALIALLKENPYQTPPSFETLLGRLEGAYLRRINIKYRLVYRVHDDEGVVKVISLWSHYDVEQ